jgi:hypothetical protein
MTHQWAETKRQRRFNWQAALVIVALLAGCGKPHTEVELCQLAVQKNLTCQIAYFHRVSNPWGVVCRSDDGDFVGLGDTRAEAVDDTVREIIRDHRMFRPQAMDEITTIGKYCPEAKP